jgi:P-type conjugative transfer protein TrbL
MTDGGLLNTVLGNFQGAISGAWGPSLSAYLLPLLLALVTLQFGMIAIEAAIARDVPLLLMHVLLGIIRVSIVVAIFQHSFDWGNAIVQTGQTVGENVAGLDPTTLTPSAVWDTGLSMTQTIWHAKAAGGWLEETMQAVAFFVAGCAVAIAWMIASLLYLGALLEGTLLVYTGPLVIAFTPLSWTFDMLIVWGKYLLQIAFKIALILMTLAIGNVLATQWTATAAAASTSFSTNAWALVIIILESCVFAWFVWKIPSKFSGLASGGAVVGFTEGLIAMGGQGASGAVSSAMGSVSSGGQGSSGGVLVSSEGWGAQAAHGVANAGKALAQKVQAALTK